MSDGFAQEMMLLIAEMDEKRAKRAEAFSGVEPDALAVACGQAIEQLWQPCHASDYHLDRGISELELNYAKARPVAKAADGSRDQQLNSC